MHFMLQLEVVQRLAAKPGSKTYGRLSIMAQYYCQVEHLFDVPRGAFNPQPKVISAIVKLTPHKTLPHVARDMNLFNHLLRSAFSQRRKTLRNTVKHLASAEQMETLAVDLSLRPEQIDLPGFVALTNQLSDMGIHTPAGAP
jgi:16S rRNA (adenine1518-N6/adenine1519-N6)-dimethyltransferase